LPPSPSPRPESARLGSGPPAGGVAVTDTGPTSPEPAVAETAEPELFPGLPIEITLPWPCVPPPVPAATGLSEALATWPFREDVPAMDPGLLLPDVAPGANPVGGPINTCGVPALPSDLPGEKPRASEAPVPPAMPGSPLALTTP